MYIYFFAIFTYSQMIRFRDKELSVMRLEERNKYLKELGLAKEQVTKIPESKSILTNYQSFDPLLYSTYLFTVCVCVLFIR